MKSWQSLPREIVKFSHLYRSTVVKMLKLSRKLIPKEFPLNQSPDGTLGWKAWHRTPDRKAPGQARPRNQDRLTRPNMAVARGRGDIICQTLWYTWHAEICSEFPAIKVWLIPWPRELWLGMVQREGFIHKSRKERLQKVRGSKVTVSWETKLNLSEVIFDGVWKFSSWLRWQKCNFIQDRWWSGEMWRTIYSIPDPSHWGIYSSDILSSRYWSYLHQTSGQLSILLQAGSGQPINFYPRDN